MLLVVSSVCLHGDRVMHIYTSPHLFYVRAFTANTNKT